jgi:hypothetical protein
MGDLSISTMGILNQLHPGNIFLVVELMQVLDMESFIHCS